MRTERGGEFLSKEFDRFLADHGIRRQLTTAHTPSQNGVAERKNCSVIEMGRTMLEHSGLPKHLWGEASATAVHIAPTSALPGMTPFEALTGSKPSCAHLRVFGCPEHVHVPKEQRSKLDHKSVPYVFLGYSSISKAYQLWDPAVGKLTISRDVIFDEHSTSSSDAALLPLPLTLPPSAPSSSSAQRSTSAAAVAPSSSTALPKPLYSEGDSSDSFADEDPLVTRRVPRWLY